MVVLWGVRLQGKNEFWEAVERRGKETMAACLGWQNQSQKIFKRWSPLRWVTGHWVSEGGVSG